MRPEFDFQVAEIDEIARMFARNGCALLRNFCPEQTLQDLHARLDELHGIVKSVHLSPDQLQEHGVSQPQEYLFSDKHKALMARVFKDVPYKDLRGNVTRRMLGGWQSPLAAHVDAFFHPMGFTVNFWVPLQPCGVTTPSLGVVCAPYEEIIRFTGFQSTPFWEDREAAPGENFAHFRPEMRQYYYGKGRQGEGRAEIDVFFGDRVWKPVFEYGDAMMLSNWTLHFTHANPGMSGERRNIEMRFHSQATPDQVVEKLRLSLAQDVAASAAASGA